MYNAAIIMKVCTLTHLSMLLLCKYSQQVISLLQLDIVK